jgi:zinc transporter ZupT
LNQTAYETHSKHDCALHNNEAGQSPIHNFLTKGVPSNAYSRIPQSTDLNSSALTCYTRPHSNPDPTLHLLPPPSSAPFPFSPSHSHDHLHSHNHSHDLEELRCSTVTTASSSSLLPSYGSVLTTDSPPLPLSNFPSLPNRPLSPPSSRLHDHSHSHSHSHSPSKSSPSSSLKTFWIALVIHSTMEGLGIGAADSFISQVSVVFAILIHKVFESIALAGLLAEGGREGSAGRVVSSLQSRMMFGIFALATPLGALCTALIQSYIESSSSSLSSGLTAGKILDGVVTALASGSFMSVTLSLSVSLPLTSAGTLGRWRCSPTCSTRVRTCPWR